jgi:hypothetical protein
MPGFIGGSKFCHLWLGKVAGAALRKEGAPRSISAIKERKHK